jgi:ABC-type lipoprotein export system ATPase subunit
MLEIRNLSKTYHSKTGESVKALDNINITFAESGMVFILGKSGSGKSTLLNVMGGLDSYDSGEFVIMGKSSKDFAGSDFDAYRNTFIGFIFQEYNVLDDFTVGANIGLALELQGKKATDEKITEILSKVDLLSYAKRKPNELSGGQKQRVAIARALVKEPQIIMADEPTGALDSNTGKQIFDTLKELSKEKLVLIVSHDRDFAEKYADRIIELSDGQIISDVTKHERQSVHLSEGLEKVTDNILRIKGGYRLTAADLENINAYLASNNSGDILLSSDGKVNSELRSAAGIGENGNTSVFEGTRPEKDVKIKEYDKNKTSFIHSRLPMKNAVKMGSSGLKHKKFRLVMTILLSLIAFTMFGFADTLAAYNKVTAAAESIADSNIKNASVELGVKTVMTYSDGDSHSYYNIHAMNDEDIEYLRKETGLDFVPVYTGGTSYYKQGFSVAPLMQSYDNNTMYTAKLTGFVNMSEESISSAGLNVTGRLPNKAGEIAITEFMYRQFNQYGFKNKNYDESVAAKSLTMTEGDANSIIGKHITISDGNFNFKDPEGYTFVIVGVVDTQFDYDRYARFMPDQRENGNNSGSDLADMVLQVELESELNYGFHALGITRVEDIVSLSSMAYSSLDDIATHMHGPMGSYYIGITSPDSEASEKMDKYSESMDHMMQYSMAAGSSALPRLNVKWIDGVARKTLGANEIVVPKDIFNSLGHGETLIKIDTSLIDAKAIELYGEEIWSKTDKALSYAQRIYEANIAKNNSKDSNDSEALKSFIPIIAKAIGIDEDVSNVDVYIFEEYLRELSEENDTISIYSHSYENIFKSIAAYEAVIEGGLWENEAFIELMLQSEYISEMEWNEFKGDTEWVKNRVKDFYSNVYLGMEELGYKKNEFGFESGTEINKKATDKFEAHAMDSLIEKLSELKFSSYTNNHELGTTTVIKNYDFKIVGYYESNQGGIIISDAVLADYKTWYKEEADKYGYVSFDEVQADHVSGIWSFAVAPMTNDTDVIIKLAQMSFDTESDYQFVMKNAVMSTLEGFNDFIEVGSQIFLYVGIGFAVFSALLLMNFIATSISYKKREIGVLRAVGARSSDVFKIFFSEALIIALINFVLSFIVLIAAVIFVNELMHGYGINITLLTLGPRQALIMLAVSVFVALLSSFLPVYNIARRKPIDAIRDR